MKRFVCILVFVLAAADAGRSQTSITPYHERNDFLFTAPGAFKFGLYGYENPALLGDVRQPDLLLTWSDAAAPWTQFQRWGLFIGAPGVGFGTIHEKTPLGHYADYRLAFSAGDRTLSSGILYGWTIADNNLLDKSSLLTGGTLFRPFPFLSTGLTYTSALNTKGYELAGDMAGRPFGNELLTIFAEYILHRTPELEQNSWSAGIAVEAVPGLCITGRYFNTDAFSLGIQMNLGAVGVETQSFYDKNQKYVYNLYGVRLGAQDRNILNAFGATKKKFVDLGPVKRIDYQRFLWFDNTQTLRSLLDVIDAAKNDASVAGIAVNTSQMETDREKLWEVREKLKEFKAAGKKVFIFIDRGGIDLYHFASVADRIVMDPFGTLTLEGYLMGHTYLKGTLEKVGLGYDEWRFFKYKSANESLSRDKMSDADREQRQKLVDGWYTLAKSDICEARRLTPEQFDALVDSSMLFLSRLAQEKGLIDSIGRWEMVQEMVKQESGSDHGWTSPHTLAQFNKPYDSRWGEPPRIAVIYALGACAMDEGISARTLVKDVQAAADDSRVKAIVLRVDSPGGDAMASDYIAEAMRKAKGKKPVIVSQGFVAASGGYWLSMYADTIVAAPGTITGSIGVIGGWIYNKGLKESLGMSTDFVKVGAHADLGFGFRLPFIGLGVPDRNMTPDERAIAEGFIKTAYKDFVEKVSLGRKKTYNEIEPIAQGRVWTGVDGKTNGLVDVLGGLETAINIAKERAGIGKDREVTLVEMPKKGLFDLGQFMPKFFGFDAKTASDPTIELLKFRLQHNGEPLPMLPLEDVMELEGR